MENTIVILWSGTFFSHRTFTDPDRAAGYRPRDPHHRLGTIHPDGTFTPEHKEQVIMPARPPATGDCEPIDNKRIAEAALFYWSTVHPDFDYPVRCERRQIQAKAWAPCTLAEFQYYIETPPELGATYISNGNGYVYRLTPAANVRY